MQKLGIVIGCVAALAAVGCKKKDNAASSGSAAPAAKAVTPATGSAAVAAPSGGGNKADCAPGAFMDPNGAFCVVIPEGYKGDDPPKKVASGDWMVFNDEGGYTYSIKVVDKENVEDFKSAMNTKPDNKDGLKLLADEKIGADGTYQRVQNKDGDFYQRAIVKRGEGYVVCEAAPGKTPTKPEDACKTLRAL